MSLGLARIISPFGNRGKSPDTQVRHAREGGHPGSLATLDPASDFHRLPPSRERRLPGLLPLLRASPSRRRRCGGICPQSPPTGNASHPQSPVKPGKWGSIVPHFYVSDFHRNFNRKSAFSAIDTAPASRICLAEWAVRPFFHWSGASASQRT